VGGAEEYLVRQIIGATEAADDVAFRIVAPPGLAEAHPTISHLFETYDGPLPVSRLSARLIEEVRWLPGKLATVDVVHHGNAIVPWRSPGPIVLTIHDLQYLTFPGHFTRARLNYLRWMVPRSARQASAIAVPSNFVKQTVVEAFAVPEERVHVVPHGYDPPARAPGSEANVRERYGLANRHVLVYPAATYPHKRHEFLIDLMAGPLAKDDYVLVLPGAAGRAERAVLEAIHARGQQARVLRTGRVPDADRDVLIAMADALVFPSEYEGFGAPVLEAMALGTPVICNDRAALPEVVGDAALVRPLDLDGWGVAVGKAAHDPGDLVRRGRARAKQFSIRGSGEALVTVYRLAAG
jgi:alpha-1,3-rhamnosyl/mannosyltransferase